MWCSVFFPCLYHYKNPQIRIFSNFMLRLHVQMVILSCLLIRDKISQLSESIEGLTLSCTCGLAENSMACQWKWHLLRQFFPVNDFDALYLSKLLNLKISMIFFFGWFYEYVTHNLASFSMILKIDYTSLFLLMATLFKLFESFKAMIIQRQIWLHYLYMLKIDYPSMFLLMVSLFKLFKSYISKQWLQRQLWRGGGVFSLSIWGIQQPPLKGKLQYLGY